MRKPRRRDALLAALLLAPGAALGWTTPEPGTELRADLMDALRPIAEWYLGAPVEFVVSDLRVEGEVAFAAVQPQRPGGGAIELRATPAVALGILDPEFTDGTAMQALFRRSGRTWVAVDYAVGPTDVWYAWDAYCPVWGAVLPEFCDNK